MNGNQFPVSNTDAKDETLQDEEELCGAESDQIALVASTENRTKLTKCPSLGIWWAVLSALFFSAASVIVKIVVNVHPLELGTFRFLGMFLSIIPIIIWSRENPLGPRECRINLLLRGLLGALSLGLRFYAFRHLPLANASVIAFSCPVFVNIFACIFLKESCTLFNLFAVILTMVGVTLVSQPQAIFGKNDLVVDQDYIWGLIAAVLSTIVTAFVYVIIRKLKDLNCAVIIFWFSVIGILETLIAVVAIGQLTFPDCGKDRYLIVVLGFCSVAGQILLTKSLQIEDAGPVSIARSVDIVFAFVWQILLFNDKPTVFSIIGAIIVAVCVLLTAVWEVVKGTFSQSCNKDVWLTFSSMIRSRK